MATRALERFEEWDSEPFPGGYRALHDLAAEDFSGIVTAGGARLCMLNGTVVGILDGTVEDFEDADGTIYEAPSPALPLLALMQARNDEVKAKYYTEDTPISEVDGTLTDANFSGYIELSENVLSGDYYLVYHAGRSMAVAFVGNSKQLLTDDEAFERADGEVGIYQVRPAEVEPVEIPEPDDAGTTATSDDARDDGNSSEDGAVARAAEPAGEGSEVPDAGGDGQETSAPTETDSDGDGADSDAGADESGNPPPAGASTGADADSDTGSDGSGTSAPADAGEGADAGAASASPADQPGGTRADQDAPEGTGRDGGAAADASESATPGPNSSSRQDRARSSDTADREGDRPGNAASTRPGPASGGPGPGARSSAGADRLETYSIPSLDPSRSASRREERTAVASMGPRPEGDRAPGGDDAEPDAGPGTASGGAAEADSRESPGGGDTGGRGGGPEDTPPGPGPDTGDRRGPASGGAEPDSRSANAGAGAGAATGADARIRELEEELDETREELGRVETQLEEVRDERDALESERDALETERDDLLAERDALESDLEDLRRERDDLADERDALESEIEDLESEVEHLNSQLEGMEAQFGASPDAEERLTPAEALDRTDVFVRYESKGQATLETAHQGNASRSQVNENLGLEYHTQFDAANVAVAGKSFDTFLGETIQFRFVRWVIEDLIYEIQDTGKVAALQDLYDAIPRIDRAELNGTVNAEFTEDGGERRTQESFDVVMRDRMGNPLFVANMNDSRQAATESMMTSLVTASSHVGESTETLGASFLVTSSFFEPEALETAAEATSGGLLSRDKRESFVKLSRKRGYHLCLVEAREGKFHLAVPEL